MNSTYSETSIISSHPPEKPSPAPGHTLERKLFMPALPPREPCAHKGTFGSVAVIGGAQGMLGAAFLAARAALLSGAGRVYVAPLDPHPPAVDLRHPEIMLRAPENLPELPQLDCVVTGPGMGRSPAAIKLLEYWIGQHVPLLLDADALNLLSAHPHLKAAMQSRKAASVITPHPGEAARLLACDSADIQDNRTDSALRLAGELNAVCVLKGAGSICAASDGQWFVNTSGNPGLATAGTGDVLSGIIGSFIAQGLSALDAAKLGVFVHGAAADSLVEQGIGPVGLTASEIALEVRNLINQYNRQA
jgi:ADP-dependent NAD(P)H-hydrate dehydratase / NAD(P)H-hydrate epimerase